MDHPVFDLSTGALAGLAPGSPASSVLELLGSPRARTSDIWSWPDRGLEIDFDEAKQVARITLHLDRDDEEWTVFSGKLVLDGSDLRTTARDLRTREVITLFGRDRGRISGDDSIFEVVYRRDRNDLFLVFDADELMLMTVFVAPHDPGYWARIVPLDQATEKWDLDVEEREAQRESRRIYVLAHDSQLTQAEIDGCELVATLPESAVLFQNVESLLKPGGKLPRRDGRRYAFLGVGTDARFLVMERTDGRWDACRSPTTEPRRAQEALGVIESVLGVFWDEGE